MKKISFLEGFIIVTLPVKNEMKIRKLSNEADWLQDNKIESLEKVYILQEIVKTSMEFQILN